MFSLSFSVQSFLEFCKFRLFVYRFRQCLGWLLGRVWSLSFIIWSLLGSIFIEVLACHDAVVIWFIFVIVTVEIIAISLLHVVHVFDATTSQCLLLSLIWVEFSQLRLERSQLFLQTQLSFKLGNLVSVPLPHSLSLPRMSSSSSSEPSSFSYKILIYDFIVELVLFASSV